VSQARWWGWRSATTVFHAWLSLSGAPASDVIVPAFPIALSLLVRSESFHSSIHKL
jgi:hypothetical protein